MDQCGHHRNTTPGILYLCSAWWIQPNSLTIYIWSTLWLLLLSCLSDTSFKALRPGHNFAEDTFKCIFLNENTKISIKIYVKFFFPKGPWGVMSTALIWYILRILLYSCLLWNMTSPSLFICTSLVFSRCSPLPAVCLTSLIVIVIGNVTHTSGLAYNAYSRLWLR